MQCHLDPLRSFEAFEMMSVGSSSLTTRCIRRKWTRSNLPHRCCGGSSKASNFAKFTFGGSQWWSGKPLSETSRPTKSAFGKMLAISSSQSLHNVICFSCLIDRGACVTLFQSLYQRSLVVQSQTPQKGVCETPGFLSTDSAAQ